MTRTSTSTPTRAPSGCRRYRRRDPGIGRPQVASEYAADIKSFTDQKFDVIVTVGFNLTHDTIVAAKANPNTWFIGVDQAPCVDATGADDATSPARAMPRRSCPTTSRSLQEDQAGYLAGIVAATPIKGAPRDRRHRRHRRDQPVRPVRPLHPGLRPRRPVRQPAIVVKSAYVTGDFSKRRSTTRPAASLRPRLHQANKPDVLFQVAGKTGNGVLEAACAGKIYGIGVDVDQYLSSTRRADLQVHHHQRREARRTR
jgi:basic membrane protein A